MRTLTCIFLLIPLLAFAQKEHVVKEYCYVILSKDKAKIMTEHDKKAVFITDSLGNDIVFDTDLEVFNYMSRNGWELHPAQPYANPFDESLERFIFYRPIQKKEGE